MATMTLDQADLLDKTTFDKAEVADLKRKSWLAAADDADPIDAGYLRLLAAIAQPQGA